MFIVATTLEFNQRMNKIVRSVFFFFESFNNKNKHYIVCLMKYVEVITIVPVEKLVVFSVIFCDVYVYL